MDIRVLLAGVGNHMTSKLLPILKKWEINIVGIVRKDVERGDLGLNVPVYSNIEDVPRNLYTHILASGDPELHLDVILNSLERKKKCFVEKPHMLTSLSGIDLNSKLITIGYNFVYIDFEFDFENINIGTKGMHKGWSELFDKKNCEIMCAIHSVIINGISIMVHKYGEPENITFDRDNFIIYFHYKNSVKRINYDSNALTFYINIDEFFNLKERKSISYERMLYKFFYENDNETTNLLFGEKVLRVIDQIEKLTS